MSNSVPESGASSATAPNRISLRRILSDSFTIWSRNFILLYFFILTPYLFKIIIPEDKIFTIDWRSLLLFGVTFLLFSAILAGWLNMASQACITFFKKKDEISKQASNKPDVKTEVVITPADTFKLFKSFLPGIGRYFPAITGGLLIHVVVAFLAGLAINPYLLKSQSIFIHLSQLNPDPTQWQKYIQSLSLTQQSNLIETLLAILAAFFLYLGFSFLCMFWPAFVVFYGNNPLKAYGRTLMQYIRHPWPTIGFSAFFFLLCIALDILTGFAFTISPIDFPFPYLICHLLFLSSLVYMAIACFVYVYYIEGAPPPDEEPPAEKNNIDTFT